MYQEDPPPTPPSPFWAFAIFPQPLSGFATSPLLGKGSADAGQESALRAGESPGVGAEMVPGRVLLTGGDGVGVLRVGGEMREVGAVVGGLTAAGAEDLADGGEARGVALTGEEECGGLHDAVAHPRHIAGVGPFIAEGEEDLLYLRPGGVGRLGRIAEPDVPTGIGPQAEADENNKEEKKPHPAKAACGTLAPLPC